MESEKYYLWSTRAQGWLSPGGHYVGNLSDARIFGEHEALDYCRIHYKNGYSEFGLVPVSLNLLQHIRELANDKR